ncbi:MAG: SIMPL domain-containing protein [Burkholderiaceae bacterium]
MPRRISWPARLAYTAALSVVVFQAHAQQAQPLPPSGVISLTTTATQEVTRDVLGVTFSTTREGADAQGVQAALRQALEAALNEARKVAKPGAVDVQTGTFALYPRYTTPAKGGAATISGWQGSTELRVQGKDVAAIAQLSGRISTMSIARVGYSLSREAREQVEGDVSARAIAAWRSKAGAMSQQFGYAGYSVREVSVGTNDMPQPPMPMMMKASRENAAADAALPTEAGKEDVTATVTGSAQMTR